MKHPLYPLIFKPILKEKIWGGKKLQHQYNKAPNHNLIGESWEVSAVADDVSVVRNGHLEGTSLQDIIEGYTFKLLGKKNYERFGTTFPLLIKFIDAKQNVSIQLHPDDTLAKVRHNSFGKTEMWYVLQADPDANLIVGFNQKVNEVEYLKHLEKQTLTDILNFETVKEGDAYFIEAGRVHAIGAGVLIAEIQQTSDITYRIYDWDRKDAEGNSRELHNDMAIDAFKFDLSDNFKIAYETHKNTSNAMINCSFFTTNYLELNTDIFKENCHDSFLIYMCIEGDVKISAGGFVQKLNKGETVLVPATLKAFKLVTTGVKLLEIYI